MVAAVRWLRASMRRALLWAACELHAQLRASACGRRTWAEGGGGLRWRHSGRLQWQCEWSCVISGRRSDSCFPLLLHWSTLIHTHLGGGSGRAAEAARVRPFERPSRRVVCRESRFVPSLLLLHLSMLNADCVALARRLTAPRFWRPADWSAQPADQPAQLETPLSATAPPHSSSGSNATTAHAGSDNR
jgi:hypothetical protein